MGENTKIEWCDHTFNPWRGCTKVAAGCANCYAEAQAKRNAGTLGVWGPNGTRVVAAESAWNQVEKWDRDAKMREESYQIAAMTCRSEYEYVEPYYQPAIFCGSMCDVFEDWQGKPITLKGHRINVCDGCGKWWEDNEAADSESCDPPCGRFKLRMEWATLSDVRSRVFNLIDATWLTWLLLTKRPENIRPMWPTVDKDSADISTLLANHMRAVNARIAAGGSQNDPASEHIAYASERDNMPCRDNVWLGTSIACRADLDNAWHLSRCGDLCAGTFLSIEPLIEDLGDISHQLKYVKQVIVGGESGPQARPCDIDWIRSIARQCEAAGVSCFVKQLGANVIGSERERYEMCGICIDRRPGTDAIVRWKLRDKKGGDPAEWPEDLRKYRSLAWKGGA